MSSNHLTDEKTSPANNYHLLLPVAVFDSDSRMTSSFKQEGGG